MSTWANVLLNNVWMYWGNMLSPLFSFLSKLHFVRFLEFLPIFLDFSYFAWKRWQGQMFHWISYELMMALCYHLSYQLKITTMRDQNHPLGRFWIFGPYFFIFTQPSGEFLTWHFGHVHSYYSVYLYFKWELEIKW